jgi:hypothetical protein
MPNSDIPTNDDQKSDDAFGRIIPVTPIRRFYNCLRGIKGSSREKFATLEKRLNPATLDAVTVVKDLFLRSVEQFSRYDNRTEPFVPNKGKGRTPTGQRYDFARALPEQWEQQATICDMTFIAYEIDPRRTTLSAFEDGEPATHSGTGGMDLLLCSAESRPVVGEIKSCKESVGATFALIQVLTYAAELVTPNQYGRLRKYYPGAGFKDDRKVDIAIILESVESLSEDDFEYAKDLARGLMANESVSEHIAKIQFLTATNTEGPITLEEDSAYTG